MGQINIGKPIDTSLIKCCSCGKGYDFKNNIYENNILVCPHCGLKHKVDFTFISDKIDDLVKVGRLNLTSYTSQYPPAYNDTYVKATSISNENYAAHLATDPAKSLTGTRILNSWMTHNYTNQRFHIDLGNAKIIRRIYYENAHSEGIHTDTGVQNFTFWGSNTEASFLELTYGTDTGWTELTVAQNTFDQHVGADQADPKYIVVTNTTAYRYYAFKFADNQGDDQYIGVRRIELQTEDVTEFEYVGTGTFAYSGSATITIGFTYIGSGSLIYSGGATQSHTKIFSYVASGTLSFSGTGTYSVGFACVGSGTYNFSGVGLYSLGLSYAGSGVFNYSGEAVLRWGDWAEITKEASNFIEIDKETSNWSKVEKGESDWDKTRNL